MDASYLEHCKNVLEKNGYKVIAPEQQSEFMRLLELLKPTSRD